MPILDASVSTTKSLLKFGRARTGAEDRAALRFLKAVFAESVHMKPSFCRRLDRGLEGTLYPLINHL